jgi:dolichol-phosphate mannosyltransferase
LIDISAPTPPRTLVFTATYNERENLPVFLDRVFALDPSFEVLVVDDNSPDGTGQLLDSIATANPRLRVLHRLTKLGLGTAHQLGMIYAERNGYDRLITMDADLSHNPDEISSLLAALGNADFVIGSRYAPGGSSDYRGQRRFLSVMANTLARLLLRLPYYEYTTSFRAFRVEMLRSHRCSKLKSDSYSFFMETVYRLSCAGFRVVEVPINFHDRVAGTSKLPKLAMLNGMAKLGRLAFSAWFGSCISTPAVAVSGTCYNCSSPYLIELYASSRAAGSVADSADLFCCTSMSHAIKPRVIRCLCCGLMYVPEGDRPANIESLYAEAEDPLYLENREAREVNFARTFDRIAPHLPAGGRLLEIGAYCGFFLLEARKRGWNAEGVEPSRWASVVARDRFGVVVHTGFLETAAGELRPPYDVIVAWDVLEHVSDPKALLEQTGRLLRPNGLLCFSTLDAGSTYARFMGRHWPWLMDMHLFYFIRPLLARWLDQAGFDVVEMADYRHYATAPYLWGKIAVMLPSPFGRALRPLARFFPSSWVIPVSLGDVVLVVARRKVAPTE